MTILIAAFFAAAIAATPVSIDSRLAEASQLDKNGKAPEARAAYTSLLKEARPNDRTRGTILDALAALETNAGDYALAARHANEAAAIWNFYHDEAHRSASLNRAGLAHLYGGDYKAAGDSISDAIESARAAGDHAQEAEQVTNLANVDFFLGRYTDAASNYDAALRLTDARRNEPWAGRRRRIVLVNKATLAQRLGLDDQALALYREVQSSGDELRPREQAQILVNLGVLYRRLGDPIKALKMYDDAHALFAREQQVDGELGVLKNRGIVLALDLGRLDDARKNFSDALDRATKASNRREMLQAHLYRGETELRSGALNEAWFDFQASVDLAHTLGTKEEEWKAFYGLGRVAMKRGDDSAAEQNFQRAVAVIENIREAISVPLLKSDFFSDKREVYDALISVSLRRLNPQEVFELIERSHSRAWRERLGLSAPVTAAAVRKALPPGTLLLDCWSSPFGSAVATVTRDDVQIRQIEVDQKAIDALARSIAAGTSDEWRAAAARVAPGLIPPSLPNGIDNVIVVPDGPLSLVPFEVLPAGGRLLIEQAAVTYAPTAAMLFRQRPPFRNISAPWKLELRAFGDPRFGSATLDEASAVRAELAASADEIRVVDREIGGSSAVHAGADDLKRYLFSTTESAPIVHIATHAATDVNAIEQSRILFSPPNGSSAGADYLFLKEAYDLPLHDTELAVLSACDTERGALLRGEGVQSFSRAFLAAGARSTVTTLWRVPDRETVSLMKIFYYHLQRGASRSEALRQAKLRFLRSGSAMANPHYWAAFVLSGDGSDPIPRAMTWTTLIASVLGLALLAIGLVALLKFLPRGTRVNHRDHGVDTETSGR